MAPLMIPTVHTKGMGEQELLGIAPQLIPDVEAMAWGLVSQDRGHHSVHALDLGESGAWICVEG
ncbi:MAG: hypothetical protein VYE73_10520 [Acidobacteriota bacterium]|nr:hypothetical protein [Acidobacteriota bacterium]